VALHAATGVVFGLAFHELRRARRAPTRPLALGAALVEHLALFPLGALVDRYHPARGEAGLAPLLSKRAFVQATWRHTVFGLVLGRFA
jgi:hypothetical protein